MKLFVATVLLALLGAACSARPRETQVKRPDTSECVYQLTRCQDADPDVALNSFSDHCEFWREWLQCEVELYGSSQCYDEVRASNTAQLLQSFDKHCTEDADLFNENWHCVTGSKKNVTNCYMSNIAGSTCSIDGFIDCIGTAYPPSCAAEFVQAVVYNK